MESSLRLGSERICFENGNLISLISNKSSHLEGMAPTLQWGSRRHRGRVKFVFEVNGIYRGYYGLFQAVFILKKAACVFLQNFASKLLVIGKYQFLTYRHCAFFLFFFPFTNITVLLKHNDTLFRTIHVIHHTCVLHFRSCVKHQQRGNYTTA